jgi:hypothetical protein
MQYHPALTLTSFTPFKTVCSEIELRSAAGGYVIVQAKTAAAVYDVAEGVSKVLSKEATESKIPFISCESLLVSGRIDAAIVEGLKKQFREKLSGFMCPDFSSRLTTYDLVRILKDRNTRVIWQYMPRKPKRAALLAFDELLLESIRQRHPLVICFGTLEKAAELREFLPSLHHCSSKVTVEPFGPETAGMLFTNGGYTFEDFSDEKDKKSFLSHFYDLGMVQGFADRYFQKKKTKVVSKLDGKDILREIRW